MNHTIRARKLQTFFDDKVGFIAWWGDRRTMSRQAARNGS